MSLADELVYVARGAHVDVALTGKIARKLEKLGAEQRATMRAHFDAYADDGGSGGFPDTQYKFESREETGGTPSWKVAIYCFKAWQARIYGAEVTLNAKRIWIGTEIDPAKKRNAADMDNLRRAAKNLRPFIEEQHRTKEADLPQKGRTP